MTFGSLIPWLLMGSGKVILQGCYKTLTLPQCHGYTVTKVDHSSSQRRSFPTEKKKKVALFTVQDSLPETILKIKGGHSFLLNNLECFNPILPSINMKRNKSEFCSYVNPKSHRNQLDHKHISAPVSIQRGWDLIYKNIRYFKNIHPFFLSSFILTHIFKQFLVFQFSWQSRNIYYTC